jgi:hypothetical protein
MSIKNPIWLLFAVILLAILGHYSYVPWNLLVGTLVICVFSLGLWVEFDEIRINESLKGFVTAKTENMDKSISFALDKINSDERIKDRLSQKRKQVIDWLSKF